MVVGVAVGSRSIRRSRRRHLDLGCTFNWNLQFVLFR